MTALYIRLSDEEEDTDNTDKIENQKDILIEYIAEKPEFKLLKIYCDNGKTGRNFNRAAWIRMMGDVKSGKITCIIVKDLSRLGRNYIESGEYLDSLFPSYGIRFIAVNDGYDSLYTKENREDILYPLKNVINDAYSKDLSTKVKSARRIQRNNAEFTGSIASYGYLRDPDIKGHLIIDEPAAQIVKKIFSRISEGQSYSEIARKMNEEKVDCPRKHLFKLGLRSSEECIHKLWTYQTVRQIVRNPVYLGDMVQGKSGNTPLDIVNIQKTHEPIIENELFYKVQNRIADIKMGQNGRHNKVKKGPDDYLFRSKIFAANTGKAMNPVRYFKGQNVEVKGYRSPRVSLPGGGYSKLIHIREEVLINSSSDCIEKYLLILTEIEKHFSNKAVADSHRQKLTKLDKQINYINERVAEQKKALANSYRDLVNETITRDNYLIFRSLYLKEIEDNENQMQRLQAEREEFASIVSLKKPYFDYLRDWKKKNMRELVSILIEKIEVFSSTSIKITFCFENEFNELQECYENRGEEKICL